MLSIKKEELWNSLRRQKIDDMISWMIYRVLSGFELSHKGSLPFFYRLPLLPIGFSGLPSILQILTESLSILADFLCDAIDRFVKNRFLQFAFPGDEEGPTFRFLLTPNILVSLLISCFFRHPEISISLWNSVVLTPLVSAPETPVDRDDSAVFGEYDVRGSGKAFINHFVAESQAPESVTEFNSGFVEAERMATRLRWR